MNKKTLFLLVILLFSFILRFAFLSKIPPELNRDEVSVGFNAYSILKTGRDEHGRGPYPLVFRAFGDNKIPGYIYMVVPLIKLFGLNAFSVRFPAAFFGSLTILVFYFFVKEIFSTIARRNPIQDRFALDDPGSIGLLAALLLAISPFHLHYSRQQFETTVALFFSLIGLVFLLKARKKLNLIFIALPLFILSFFIYNTPLFIILPLVVWTFLVFKNDYFKKPKNKLTILIFVVLLTSGWCGYWQLAKEGNQGRATTTIFNQEEVARRAESQIFLLNKKGIPVFIAKTFYNQYILLTKDFLKNYLAAFNPQFIFFTGDNNSWHSLGNLNFGNILIIFFPFILLGFLKVVKNPKQRENLFILGYLLISAIPNGLTIDSPILTRLLNFHLVLILLAALGLEQFCQWQIKRLRYKNIILSVILLFSTINYLLTYFIIFPQTLDQFWLPGIKEVCQQVKQEEKDYDLIIFDSRVDVGYIFLAFYLPFAPADFQENSQRESSGLDRVTVYDKYLFSENLSEWKQPGYLKDRVSSGKKILLVERVVSGERPRKEANNFLIYNFLGEPLWQLTLITS